MRGVVTTTIEAIKPDGTKYTYEVSNNLDDLTRVCNDIAKRHGWHDKGLIPVGDMISLSHSELSEAYEEYRKSNGAHDHTNNMLSYEVNGKPEGIGPEFADVFIRFFHYAHQLGINLTYEVFRKMQYNETRPYRHGNKVA